MEKTTEKIEDFGEKIGGARKDLAALGRMLRGEDIKNWTAEERAQYVNKNQIFKKPDYQKMLDSGMERETVYFIKTVYDALPVKPPNATEKGQQVFVDYLNYYREKLENIHTNQQARNFFREAVLDSPYINVNTNGYRETFSISAEGYGCMTNKFFKACQYSDFTIKRGIEKRQFGYSEEEKLTSSYKFFRYDGTNAHLEDDYYGKTYLAIKQGGSKYFFKTEGDFYDPNQWETNTWVAINDNRQVVGIDYPTKELAVSAIAEIERNEQHNKPKAEPTTKRKSSFVPPQLAHIERIGQDFREGHNISGDDMLKEFGLRGGEFGNWESQNDRQANLNMAYEAFKDLAKALNISDEDVSLGNKLAMGWGSRGHGKALAHYERADNVINLTKLKGAGALAHEWGHALDCYICKMEDYGRVGMASEGGGNVTSIVYDVMDKIRYTVGEDDVYKKTEYYKDAQKLDKIYSTAGNQKRSDGTSGYWHSDVELFARAFATYVKDRLAPDGKNDYLCGHAECSVPGSDGNTIYAYPRGKEREAINAAFDRLIDKLKELDYLHQRTEMDNHKIVRENYNESEKDSEAEFMTDEVVDEPQIAAARTVAPKSEELPFSDGEFVQMTLFDMSVEASYPQRTHRRDDIDR